MCNNTAWYNNFSWNLFLKMFFAFHSSPSCKEKTPKQQKQTQKRSQCQQEWKAQISYCYCQEQAIVEQQPRLHFPSLLTNSWNCVPNECNREQVWLQSGQTCSCGSRIQSSAQPLKSMWLHQSSWEQNVLYATHWKSCHELGEEKIHGTHKM